MQSTFQFAIVNLQIFLTLPNNSVKKRTPGALSNESPTALLSASIHLTGSEPRHRYSKGGPRGDVGQLWSGLLPDEVLHGPHERLQERGAGPHQQQAGPAQGRALHGGGRNHRVHLAHPHW